MTNPSDIERDRIKHAIEWRAELEAVLAEMITKLEAESRGLPVSLERVQVRTALQALERAQASCAAAITDGQRLIGGMA